jgi:hypothetical protein
MAQFRVQFKNEAEIIDVLSKRGFHGVDIDRRLKSIRMDDLASAIRAIRDRVLE